MIVTIIDDDYGTFVATPEWEKFFAAYSILCMQNLNVVLSRINLP